MFFFRRDASLHTLYPAVHSRPKYIRDFFPLAKFELGGRRGENYIEQRSRIRQFYFLGNQAKNIKGILSRNMDRVFACSDFSP